MENKSGLKPVEYKVLVKPITVEERTAGGIILPDQVKDKEQFAKQEGIVISVSEMAFTDPDWPIKPKVGDKVLFDKYGGCTVKGKDGESYRLINDKEIGAIYE